MLLSSEDAALFYRAWGALLGWVNEQRRVVPHFSPPTPERPIDPAVANRVRNVLWADDPLREQFLIEGAARLGSAEHDLIASWRHRVSDQFILFKHLKKHSIFMAKGVYGVLGIYTPIEEMLPNVPTFVGATLLPFRGVIIIDGLLETRGPQISFGGGMKRSFKNEYDAASAAGMVRTHLPFAVDGASPVAVSSAAKPTDSKQTSSAAVLGSMQSAKAFLGRWRIVTSELWDPESLHAFEPAHFTFESRGRGGLGLIAVEAEIDWRLDRDRIEFSWSGHDDGEVATGRGWAKLTEEDELEGRIYFHQGDDSGFVAKRDEVAKSRAKTRPRPMGKK